MNLKTCPVCKEALPIESFASNKARKDGLQAQCRECRKGIVTPATIGYRAASKPGATEKGKVWSPEQVAVACNPALTIAQAAAQLGRTFNAVATMRHRVKMKERMNEPDTNQSSGF